MGDVPVLKPREVTAILEQLGFEEVRQKGSHKQSAPRQTGDHCSVHPGREISPILLRRIVGNIGLTVSDFLQHR